MNDNLIRFNTETIDRSIKAAPKKFDLQLIENIKWPQNRSIQHVWDSRLERSNTTTKSKPTDNKGTKSTVGAIDLGPNLDLHQEGDRTIYFRAIRSPLAPNCIRFAVSEEVENGHKLAREVGDPSGRIDLRSSECWMVFSPMAKCWWLTLGRLKDVATSIGQDPRIEVCHCSMAGLWNESVFVWLCVNFSIREHLVELDLKGSFVFIVDVFGNPWITFSRK